MSAAVTFQGRDLVLNARTGEALWVAPGELVPVDGDPRDIRFGPGALIPFTADESYPCAVLNAIGRDVDALEWDWPAPYDGEQRQAARRVRRKAAELERIYFSHVGDPAKWVEDHGSESFDLYPWQQRLYDAAKSGKRIQIRRGRR